MTDRCKQRLYAQILSASSTSALPGKLNCLYCVYTHVGKIDGIRIAFPSGRNMKTRKLWSWIFLLASFAFVLQVSTIAKAQDDAQGQISPDDQDQDQDQDQCAGSSGPRRAAEFLARGRFRFARPVKTTGSRRVPNRPMVTGDDLWADEDSRAEVHIGSAAIRLGAKTGITFLDTRRPHHADPPGAGIADSCACGTSMTMTTTRSTRRTSRSACCSPANTAWM